MCFSEGTHEGGGPALSVCPEEAPSRGARRGAERAQRAAGLPLSEPFPLPQENQCKAQSCNKLLIHYLTPASLLDVEGMAGGATRGKVDASLRYIIYLYHHEKIMSAPLQLTVKISLLFRSNFKSRW